nr:hypothetical protein [Candidatus Sigynarchaeota archaeon]
MAEPWRVLMEFDDVVIVCLVMFFAITVIWRYFFRWDTRHALKIPGIHRETCTRFSPLVPKKDDPTIIVVARARHNPLDQCTWLVQGLLAAGFQVLLIHNVLSLKHDASGYFVQSIIDYDDFSKDIQLVKVMEQAIELGIPRLMLVNYRGEIGAQRLLEWLEKAGTAAMSRKIELFIASRFQSPSIQSSHQQQFKGALLIQRSRDRLRDAELLVVASILKWLEEKRR